MRSSRPLLYSTALAVAGFVALCDGASLKAAVVQAMRNVYLNGVDISSARSQELKNVDLVINEKGDIFIVAPHYQVNEEDTYVPLSKYAQGAFTPKHQPMRRLEPEAEKPMDPASPSLPPKSDVPLTAKPATNSDGTIAKAGTPLGAGGAMPAADNAGAAPTPAGEKLDGAPGDAPKAEPVKADAPPAP